MTPPLFLPFRQGCMHTTTVESRGIPHSRRVMNLGGLIDGCLDAAIWGVTDEES